jgi:hypothetical protein
VRRGTIRQRIWDRSSIFVTVPFPLIEHLSFRPCCGMTMEYVTGWVQANNLRSLKFTGVSEDVQRTLQEFLPPLLAACSDSLTSLCLDLNDKCTSESIGLYVKKLTIEISREFKQSLLDHGHLQSDNGRFRFPFKLTDLVHLEYLAIYGAEDWENAFPVQGHMELISTAAPSLKQVHLHLKWDLYNRCVLVYGPHLSLLRQSVLPYLLQSMFRCIALVNLLFFHGTIVDHRLNVLD